jgi:hypothetical protein
MDRHNLTFRQAATALLFWTLTAGFYSCEKVQFTTATVDPGQTFYFQADIQPVFNNTCINCHNGGLSPDLRTGKSYSALKNGGYLNTPAETSKLYTIMNKSSHLSRSTENDRLKVLGWIRQGALNN